MGQVIQFPGRRTTRSQIYAAGDAIFEADDGDVLSFTNDHTFTLHENGHLVVALPVYQDEKGIWSVDDDSAPLVDVEFSKFITLDAKEGVPWLIFAIADQGELKIDKDTDLGRALLDRHLVTNATGR